MTEKTEISKYKFFAVGAMGTFMATLDGSILNVALPTISNQFQVSIDTIAWVILAYSLTLISLLIVFGAWAGIRGYFFAYRWGFVFFVTGSLICSLSPSFAILIVGRVIQAIGSAMFAANSTGLVTKIFPAEERGRGIGLIVMIVSAGFMVGPPLGGFLIGFWSWHAIFIINIPIGIVGFILTHRYFRFLPEPKLERKIPLQGAIALGISLVVGTFMLSLISDYPVSDYRIWGMGIISLLFGLGFLYFESKEKTALIGLDIFKNKPFTFSILAMLFIFMSIASVFIFIPFYLEDVHHFVPNQVGLILIILPIMMFIFSPLAGKLSDKIGFRFLTVLGILILIAGLYLVGRFNEATSTSDIALALVVVGAGVGTFSTPNSSALMGSVKGSQRAVTSGILATTRNLGMSTGVALSTALYTFFEKKYENRLTDVAAFLKSYPVVINISIIIAIPALIFSFVRVNKLISEDGES